VFILPASVWAVTVVAEPLAEQAPAAEVGAQEDENAEEGESESPAKAPSGRLEIEGDRIEKLTLYGDTGGQPLVFEHPQGSLTVPAGQYYLVEVELEGGYSTKVFSGLGEDSLAITADKPRRLRVGPPLTPSVEATRQGRFLNLQYQLLDATGNTFAPGEPDDRSPPKFVVRQGGQEIGSGQFEYG
jgi:hypothetical protein